MDRGEETLRMNRNKNSRRRNLDANVYGGKRRDRTIDATSGRESGRVHDAEKWDLLGNNLSCRARVLGQKAGE